MKCQIKCDLHNHEFRGYNITAEQRVWPCCFFANGWDKRFQEMFTDEPKPETRRFSRDKILMGYLKEDPDFNSLEHYSLDEILQHPLFTQYAFYTGWESDNPPIICEAECGLKTDRITGAQIKKSSVDAKDYLNST